MAFKRSRKDFETDLLKQESPFVVYGTPLPPLDEHARDDGSYVPVWKQEVTDDRGRKRLHGAFTGGFSAGYFNTVGSKEGWTPSTFISSRSNRAKDGRDQIQQRAEDFMDEEDIREQDEARNLSTSDGFAGFGTADDVNLKNSLMDLFRPAEDSVGMKLLNKMGWRQGHGIGPKIRRRTDPENDSSEVHLFAPEDAPMLSFLKKAGYGGLGFAGEGGIVASGDQSAIPRQKKIQPQSDDEDESRPGLSFASRAKKSTKPKSGAFGIGILNDTGSDDEDPYSMGPKISYNRTLGGDKRSQRNKTGVRGNANPLLKNKPVFVPKRLGTISNVLRKCHDGRLPLAGFVLADELDNFSIMSLSDNKYKPPTVPDGWKPSREPTQDQSSETDVYASTAEAAKLSQHTSTSRGALLGESILPGKSVFDYLTPAAREKLVKSSGKTNLPPALSESLPGISGSPSHQNSLTSEIPPLDHQTALQALSRTLHGGFTPYPNDPPKAARYKAYLESQANTSPDNVTPSQIPLPPNTTQEDHLLELHEFARTAEVFKPVSGLIASRFTTSTSTSATNINDTNPSDPTSSNLMTKPTPRPQTPAEQAASIGMFGPLTRSITAFQPARLLCKRFGVAMPAFADMPQTTGGSSTWIYETASGSGSGNGTGNGSGGGSGSDINSSIQPPVESSRNPSTEQDKMGRHTEDASNKNTQQLISQGPFDMTTTEAQAPYSEADTINPDENEALEQERPGDAVFRAIFGDSDSDGEEDEHDNDE